MVWWEAKLEALQTRPIYQILAFLTVLETFIQETISNDKLSLD